MLSGCGLSVATPSVFGMALSHLEHQALQVEGLRGRTRSDAIYALGLTVNTHAQLVLALAERQDAIEAYPLLCARIRRLRDARKVQRRAG